MKRTSSHRYLKLAFWILLGLAWLGAMALNVHLMLGWIHQQRPPIPEPTVAVVVLPTEEPPATPTSQPAGPPAPHWTKTPIVYAPEFPSRVLLPTPTETPTPEPEPTATPRPPATMIQKG